MKSYILKFFFQKIVTVGDLDEIQQSILKFDVSIDFFFFT